MLVIEDKKIKTQLQPNFTITCGFIFAKHAQLLSYLKSYYSCLLSLLSLLLLSRSLISSILDPYLAQSCCSIASLASWKRFLILDTLLDSPVGTWIVGMTVEESVGVITEGIWVPYNA